MRQWSRVSSGEHLFGLAPTPLDVLQQTQEEIATLEQLYGLYTTVLGSLKERGSLTWGDAKDSLDEFAAQVGEFQSQSRRMPKEVKDWPSYKDCRKLVDDLTALMPLLQGLAHKSVQDRHWAELQSLVGVQLPLPSEGLSLRHLLEAGLLAHKEEVEDLCSAVIKEEVVEKKLVTVADQWRVEMFTFADHKQRGPVVLKASRLVSLFFFL